MGKLILTRKVGESVNVVAETVLTIREVHVKKVYIAQTVKGITVACWLRLHEDTDVLENCNVSVSAISCGRVKLYFDADNSVKIMRSELV